MTDAAPDKLAIQALADRVLARFLKAGAARVEAAVLQPADVLLDLYGEDIRGRAFTTSDPLRGEQMLRPDFTVPVVQRHMIESAEPARYAYAGDVFRRQEENTGRPSEYMQVGYEVFDRGDAALIEAEVLALFTDIVGPGATVLMGDLGIVIAALDTLPLSPPRRAALRRHIWRPARFRALLDRFAHPIARPAVPVSGPQIGLRTQAEVSARLAALEADADEAPLDGDAVRWLESLMDVQGAPDAVLDQLTAMQAPTAAIGGLASRLAAFEARNIDLSRAKFSVTYGRTAMEYYDGFVFGLTLPDVGLVATGGRYDALTAALGQGRSVPAVGGVIRPGELVKAAAC